MPWAAVQAGCQTLAALATGLQQVIAAEPAMHHSAQHLSALDLTLLGLQEMHV